MSWIIDIVEAGVIPDLPMTIYRADADPGERLNVPCYCYLLTGGGTAVLVDTGPERAASAAAGLVILGDAPAALSAALGRRGLTFDGVGLIVHTHLHYDHMQNDGLFPQARVVVQRREWEWASSESAGPFYVGIPDLVRLVGDRLRLVEGEQELIEGVALLPNGGHTPGHQSVLVETESGSVCLCADIIPMAFNLDIAAPSLDDAATRAFMQRLRVEGWEAIPGHDPLLRRDTRYVRPEVNQPQKAASD